MAQRQRRDGVAVEVALQEAVGGHAEYDHAGGGVLDDGGTVLLDEGEDAEDAADADGALMARSAIPFVRVEPPLLGRLDLMIGRAMSGSLRSASRRRPMLERQRIGICTLCAPYASRRHGRRTWLELVSN